MLFDPSVAPFVIGVCVVLVVVLVGVGFARFGFAGVWIFGGYALIFAAGLLLLPLVAVPLVVPVLVLFLVAQARSRLLHGSQAIWSEAWPRPELPAPVAEVVMSFEGIGASVAAVLTDGEQPQPSWVAYALTPGTEVLLQVAWRTAVSLPPEVVLATAFVEGGGVTTLRRSLLPSASGSVVQAFPGSTVERLAIEHATAVRWLREHGFTPVRTDPADLLRMHVTLMELVAARLRARSWATAFELWWRSSFRRSRDVGSVVGRPGVVDQLRAAPPRPR